MGRSTDSQIRRQNALQRLENLNQDDRRNSKTTTQTAYYGGSASRQAALDRLNALGSQEDDYSFHQAKQKRISSILQEAQKYAASIQKKLQGMNWSNADQIKREIDADSSRMLKEYGEIKQYIDTYGDQMDASAKTSLENALKWMDDLRINAQSAAGSGAKKIASFESEDAWIKGAVENRTQRQQKYADNQKQIQALQAQRDQLMPNAMYNADSNLPVPVFDAQYVGQKKALDAQIKALQEENRNYEQGKNGWYSKELDDNYEQLVAKQKREQGYQQKYAGKSYAQLNQILSRMVDGEEKEWLKAYAPTVMTVKDYDAELAAVDQRISALEAQANAWKTAANTWSGNVGDDPVYLQMQQMTAKYGSLDAVSKALDQAKRKKYELENGRKYNFLEENEGFSSLAKADLDNINDYLYRYINDKNLQNLEAAQAMRGGSGYANTGYDKMTEGEISKFNYLYHTQGKKEAEEYLATIKNELSGRRQQAIAQTWSDVAEDHKVLADAASVAGTLMGGLGYIDVLGQKIGKEVEEAVTGKYAGPINYNSVAMTPSITASAIRSTRSQNLADEYGVIQMNEQDHPYLSRLLNGKSWGDVYQLGMSMVDSAAVAALSPVIGTAGTLMLSGNAATQTMLDAVANGASDEQALTMGAVSGAFEYLFEKYELEGLLRNGSKNAVRAFAAQALSEGFGEGATTIANLVADTLIMADKSQLSRAVAAYMEKNPGMSEKEATKKAITDMAVQTGWDALGGMVTGGIMGGGYSAIDKVSTGAGYAKVGQGLLQDQTAIGELVSLAGNLGADLTEQAQRVTQKPTSQNVGKLYTDVASAIFERGRSALTQQLHRQGVATNAAQQIADVVVEARSGRQLSDQQQSLVASIQRDSNLRAAMDAVFDDPGSAVYQLTQRLQNINQQGRGQQNANGTVVDPYEGTPSSDLAALDHLPPGEGNRTVEDTGTYTANDVAGLKVIMAQKLAEHGVEDKTAQRLAPVIVESRTGSQVSAQQAELLKAMESDSNIQAAVNEVFTDRAQRNDLQTSRNMTTNAISKPLEQYSSEKQSLIRSYIDAVDTNIKKFVARVKSGDLSFKRQKISDVSDRAAADIGDILGIDVSGYTNNINTNGVRHILNRHGESGEHDTTMSLDDDIARVGWVLDNYDSVEMVTENGEPVLSSEFRDKNDVPAYQVRFTKRIDGSYYVVEAACENSYKKLWVQSAYLQKNEDVTQAPAEGQVANHETNARSALASPSSDITIHQPLAGVNGEVVADEVESAEGKVLRVSSGTAAQGVKFASFRNGKVMVDVGDGSAVAVNDIAFDNEEDQLVFQTIAGIDGMTTPAANAIWQSYKRGGAQIGARKFARAAAVTYRAGFFGNTAALNDPRSDVAALPVAYRNMIFQEARKASRNKADAQQTNVNTVYAKASAALQEKGKALTGTGRVKYASHISAADLSDTQNASIQLAQQIAPAVGADIVVYDGGREWGHYNPATDEIHLNVNAKWNRASMMAYTMAHELAHRAKAGSPAKFKAFADFLIQEYGKQGVSLDAMLVEQIEVVREYGIQMTEEEAFEEVVADACQKMLLDTDAGKKLAEFGAKNKQNRSFLEQLKSWINELMDKLRSLFRNVDPDSTAAQEFARFEENTKQILADMFVDMSLDAGEKLSTIKAAGMLKNTTDEGGVKNKVGKMTQADIQAVQNIGRISVNQFSTADIKATERFAQQYWNEMGVKSPFFRAWFGDWRENDQTKVQLANKKGDIRGVQKNDDTGWDIQVSGKVFNESGHKAKKNQGALAYLPYINDVVKKAVLLDSFGVGQGNSKSSNSLLMHSMYAVADIGNGPVLLKLFVEEMNDPNADNTVKRAYQLQNIEMQQLSAKGSSVSSSPVTSTATIRTVADLFAAVKQKDAAFQPKPTSKVVNPDGTPMVVHHGTNNSFNTFRSKSGAYWFSESEDYAEAMMEERGGGEVKSVYLNMRNPYRAKLAPGKFTDPSYEAPILQKARQNGHDGVIIENQTNDPLAADTFYVVFDPAQIKSATDNIGTFDGSNPDIRYKLPTGTKSDRQALVDMFEQMVTNSNEYKVLQDYKKHIDEMLSLEEKLERLSEEIKRVSFAEGPRDMEYLKNLKLQQAQTVNRLNYYDNKLLSLEKSGVLKAMIERNRKQAAQKSYDKAKEYYRQKSEARETEIRQYYRESRRQAVERHDQAQVRQQIRKDVEKLDGILNRGNKEKNVKLELKEFAGAALRVAKGSFLKNYNEYDMIRSGVNISLERGEKPIFARCQELLRELDKIRDEKNAEPGPDNMHEKWDPEAVMRRDDREEAMKKELAKNMKILRDAGIFRKENEAIEDGNADQLMDELMEAYEKLQNSGQEHVRRVYSAAVYAQMDKVKEFLAGKAIKDMTAVELTELHKMYRMVLHTITHSNDLFAQKRKADVKTLGEEVISQLQTEGKEMIPDILDTLAKMGWANLKPETALEVIGSDTLTEMMQGLYRGEDTYARDIEDARRFAEEQGKKYGRKNWDMEKLISFAGTKITLGQAMSLYAYTKRKQAQGHLEGDGFTNSTNVRIKEPVGKLPVKLSYIMNATKTHMVSRVMYEKVEQLLTPEQKQYADAMQEYLSKVMGAKGNEVSMQMYGIKLFEEKAYFPLKTAQEYHDEALGATTGEVKLKNSGFTKKVQEKASNPIVLDSFEAVWAAHVDKMSLYHGFVLPMEDFDRVYNYHRSTEVEETNAWGEAFAREVDSNETVKVDIQNKAGKAANDYIENFMKQLNGGVRGDATEKLFGSLVRNFKKTAVLGSLSVAVQQPTAFIRAMAYLDLRDVIDLSNQLGKDGKPEGKLVEEMYKYAPVALMKHIGGFDPGLGRTTEGYIFEEKKTVRSVLDKFLGSFPEKMDEWTWAYIWMCTKRQIHRKYPSLKIGSEEFNQKAGERFSQIIRDTQVYDSVLTKTQIMRSKNVFLQMATSFMNEPSTGMDMYIRSTLQAKRGKISKAQAARTYASVVGSQILAAAVAAFVYALRDDDEDETYWEKYISAAVSKAWENLMPWYSIPFVKDIFSIFAGYSVERSDMSIITDIYQGWQKLGNSNASTWEKVEGFGGSILNLFGFSLKNFSRDIRGIWNTVDVWFNKGIQSTGAGMRYALQEGITGKKPSKAVQLQNAVAENDPAHIVRLLATYSDEDAALNAFRSAVKSAYQQGQISEKNAVEYLQAYAGSDEADAQEKVNEWRCEFETGIKYGDIREAFIAGELTQAKAQEMFIDYGGYGDDEAEAYVRKLLCEKETGVAYDDIREAFVDGKITEKQLKQIYVKYGGHTEDEADVYARELLCEKETGVAYDDIREAFVDGEITEKQARQMYIRYGGYSAEDAEGKVEILRFRKKYPESELTDGNIPKYLEFAEPVGISPEIYDRYLKATADLKADKDANGKTISGSKRQKVLAAIHKLPLSRVQKDALYFANGYAEGTLDEAPWY